MEAPARKVPRKSGGAPGAARRAKPAVVVANTPTSRSSVPNRRARRGANSAPPPKHRIGRAVRKDAAAGAQLGRALVEGERIETQRQQIEQNIQVDVRNALQMLRTAEARLRAAAIARANSVKQYESEQRKLDNGQSDIYRVLERQTALTSARSAELRAQTELNKAISDLQRATGNSLKANNVETRLR
jgi:hypothetical protein